jgi:hypothetical protein
MAEDRGGKRAGAGRKPKSPAEKMIPKTIRLTPEQIAFCGKNLSRTIRALIDEKQGL